MCRQWEGISKCDIVGGKEIYNLSYSYSLVTIIKLLIVKTNNKKSIFEYLIMYSCISFGMPLKFALFCTIPTSSSFMSYLIPNATFTIFT